MKHLDNLPEGTSLNKDIVKEAIKEWLNEKVTEFGWFSIKTILYACVAAVGYLWLTSHGWSLPK
jgi:hypothetical protein